MPSYEENAETRALSLFNRGSRRAAAAVLSVAISRSENAGNLWLLRGIIRHSQAEWPEALGDLETAMCLIPLPASGQLVLADCYAQTGHRDLALMAYERLLDQESLPGKLYAGLYAGFQKCGRGDLAIKACRAAIVSDPDDHEAYFAMAHCMARLSYSSSCVSAALEKACHLAPDNDTYRISLAMQLISSDRPHDAYRHLAQASIEKLRHLDCLCSAKRLLQLCITAGDNHRRDALDKSIKRLVSTSQANRPSP